MSRQNVLRHGFGWDKERTSEIPWWVGRRLRYPLSKWFRIGQWFGASETCRKCGMQANEAEYAFRRVGFGRAECLPELECESNLAGDAQDDRREFVASVIRATLDEFAERNEVEIPSDVLDNLAYWVANEVPSGYARAYCPNIPHDCACMGLCHIWRRVEEPPA